MNIINLYENYNSDLKAIFEQCSKIAAKNDFKLYLIGGMVRDLLLNRKGHDVDITVEGNAIEFAEILKKEYDAKILSVHESFGTVKVEIQGQKIDLASTRSESYPKAGHLPHVDEIGCSLEKDVLRRDFTVNALALSLHQDNFADLIDYTGGLTDLKAKKIRVLHDKSFIDDPTRIIRALKYSTRLGFELDEKTLKLQKEYLQNINYDMCYKRVKQEIKKTFEQNSQEAFNKFIEQGIYKLIASNLQSLCHPGLVSGSYRHTTLDRSRNKFGMTPNVNIDNLINKYKPKHLWLVYYGVLAVTLNIELSPTKYEKEVIEEAERLKNKIFTDDFELYKEFCAQKIETLLILAVLGKEKEVCHYLNDLAKIKLHVNGNDLIKLGFEPSKKFSEAFDYALKEKLKKPKMTKAEEIELIKRFLVNERNFVKRLYKNYLKNPCTKN
jgi:tRNA nucleotidyltransferase (CCA-adding enzyme)